MSEARGTETQLRELEAARDRLEDECSGIAHQIDMAKARAVDGEYSDPVWYRKAQHALRMKRKEYNATLRLVAELKRAQRRVEHNSNERWFVKVAKRRLDEEVFASIWEEASGLAGAARCGEVKGVDDP